MPNVRVPYHGVDEWTRIVISLGGTALVALAALLAFAARRGGALGYPLAAAVPLATLYLVPVMQRDTAHQFWGGAAFTLLLVAFLWLERVDRYTAPMAAGLVATAILAGLVLGPGLDRDTALLDYENLAQALSVGRQPALRLEPRLRAAGLRAPAARCCASALATAPTGRPRTCRSSTAGAGCRARTRRARAWTKRCRRTTDEWVQQLRVTFRALNSLQFIGAGTTISIDRSPRDSLQTGPGTFTTTGKPLKRGNAYQRPCTRRTRRASSCASRRARRCPRRPSAPVSPR